MCGRHEMQGPLNLLHSFVGAIEWSDLKFWGRFGGTEGFFCCFFTSSFPDNDDSH